jgi:hypothetical protein
MTNELYQKVADFYKLAKDLEFEADENKRIEDILRETKYGIAIESKNPDEAAQKPAFKAEWNEAIVA